ncbi:HAMP domain-containing sensor histidine kinase [Mesobacterium sp. TK19101]|uniref:histidine kinase n=1 Tax=Mesobacterium hydrothermale TaxID=3111907 RepID=A0ABU6HH53_9RHOB|nr:HAMP domain-containing sensor histidine kinase [Mesobacterium sp. TK19101]MEC3861797.1 HAMP domain-containing sensor histidine kinase [Mesobacterium sp. TK19101]
MSLRLRLALAGAFAILIALGLAALGLSQLFAAHVERRAEAELTVHLDQVLAGLDLGPDGLTLARPPADPRFALPYGGLYWQIEGAQGIERSRSLWDVVLVLPDDTLNTGQVHLHRLPGPPGQTLLVLERSVTLPARLGGGAVRAALGMDLAELAAARRDFITELLPFLGLLAVVLIAAGWVQLSVGLRPLRGLGDRVAALRAGKAARMGQDWPAEVRPVAAEIDELLTARAAETERARSRAADLAHGLKTPLQALMGEAERLRSHGATDKAAGIEDIARAMRRTVDRELARTRTAARAADALCDPAQVADRLIAVLKRTPDGADLEWHQDIPPGLAVALHDADLAEALGAIAENAARHATARVRFSALPGNATVSLCVADDGSGIPEAQRDALVHRHARADTSGTGLGLSIAAEIAEAAGGCLGLSDNTPGLIVTLTLPRAHAPRP